MKKWLGLVLLLTIALMAKSTPHNRISITNIYEEKEKNSLSLCLRFSHYFSNVDEAKMKKYIRVSPKINFELSLSYRRICINNLKPQTDYTIEVNQALPLGAKFLDKSYRLSYKTTNFKPSVSFEDKGYILPTYGEISIPIKSRNVQGLEVSLYRINQHNLIGMINEYGFIRSMYRYKLSKIASTDGYFLWKKILPLHTPLNKQVTTAIPLEKLLKKREAGVYILAVKMLDKEGEEMYDYQTPMQWFMVSDIGLFSLKSDKGLTVLAKSLSLATPYNEIRLELIAKNNEILKTLTVKNGEAFFPASLLKGENGLVPKAIYAYGKEGDFCVLDLSSSSHDLSDRGVKGRENSSLDDVFIYSNRGVFKPSEKVTLHGLIRDKLGFAKKEGIFALQLFDSRGVKVLSSIVKSDDLGHFSKTIELSDLANTGKYRVELLGGDKKPIGVYSFLVEDFVPPKIRVELENSPKKVIKGEKNLLEFSSSYLSGGMVKDTDVLVNTILHTKKEPFKAYKSYHFGDMKEKFSHQQLSMHRFKTDEKGKGVIPFILAQNTYSSLPIFAHIDIGVNELGGRAVHKIMDVFYEDKQGYIGLKPLFTKGAINQNEKARFHLIYLKNSHLEKRKLHYRVIKEKRHWHWRSSNNGEWEYFKTYSDSKIVTQKEVQTSKKGAVDLELMPLDWGVYRVEVKENNEIMTTYRFTSGYEESSSKSSPDKLPVSIDKEQYQVGDTIRIAIEPKFTGFMDIFIGHHTLLEKKHIAIKQGVLQEVSFKVKESWGNSAYALASAFRAGDKKLGAKRAIGVAHIAIRHPEKQLHLTLSHTKKTPSSSKVKVKLHCKEAKGIKTAFTLSAVDEGVLNLTNYQTPNTIAYFLGQKKLGLEIKDIYGRLIQAKGTHAKFNVGAGDALKVRINDGVVSNKENVVSLFLEPTYFDENGEAEVTLNIPNYQGSLRLVGVAWNAKATGVAQSDVVVKDDIVIDYYMPKFLSVGDSAKTLLNIGFNQTLPKGQYHIYLSSLGGVKIQGEKAFTFFHQGKEDFKKEILLEGVNVKEGVVVVEVEKEGKVVADKEWHIGLRATYPQSYIKKLGILQKNRTLDPKKLINQNFFHDIHALSLELSLFPLLPTKSLASELLAYQGRCAEQTTSRAFPWLFKKIRTKEENLLIKEAIGRLLSYQKVEGAFGLWRGSRADIWVSAYVLDFLIEAKTKGFEVPSYRITKGLDWLENHINRWDKSPSKKEGDIYALSILTKANRILMSQLNFYAKSRLDSALSYAHLGVSFAYIGEKQKAKKFFNQALDKVEQYSEHFYSNYGGYLRDSVRILTLLKKSGVAKQEWSYLFDDILATLKEKTYFSTQEMSALLRLSFLLQSKKSTLMYLQVKNKAIKTKEYRQNEETLSDYSLIQNKTQESLWYEMSAKATPDTHYYKRSEKSGFKIEKHIYELNGKEIEYNSVKSNERFIVILEGEMRNRRIKHPLITDWLGAGFEIENPHLLGIDPTLAFKWIKPQTKTKHKAYRNDRFEVALESEHNRSFRVAYMIRSVTKGRYTLPPAQIVDMYQPHYRGLSQFLEAKISIKNRVKKVSELKSQKEQLKLKEYHHAFTKRVRSFTHLSVTDLYQLRKAIFAQAGLSYKKSNPMLHQQFSQFSWYHPYTFDEAFIYKKLTRTQKRNIVGLKVEERRRGGGLLLKDFYRVSHKALTLKDIRKYSKKELKILRNSLIARFGYDYRKTKSLHQIYRYMPWYHPTKIGASEILDIKMKPFLKKNVLLMLKRERAL